MPNEEPVSFEQILAELERIVDRLDAEELELDEALQLFEVGVARLRRAGRLLDEARGRVDELVEGASGELELIGFDVGEEEDDDNDAETASHGPAVGDDT